MSAFLFIVGGFLLIAAGGLLITALQTRNSLAAISAIVALVLGLLGIAGSFSLVDVAPNERLVVFNRLTGRLGTPRGPGIHFVNPITNTYQHYDISRQSYTMSAVRFDGEFPEEPITARTAGGQQVLIDITVLYRLDTNRINDIHTNWPNERYRTELLRPLMRSVVRDAVSEFPVESVYQQRTIIDARITETVSAALDVEGFLVEEILVRNITFTEEYAASIEEAQIAEVRIRQEEFRVEEVTQQAAQVEARARGEAEARIIQAEAEAQALERLANVLSENPILLEYQYVQNLSDNIQILALPANSPFIFDLQGVMPGGSGTSNTVPRQQPVTPPTTSDTDSDGN